MARKAKMSDCAGCKDDFYNGHNDLGVERCWMLDDAEMVRMRVIPLDMAPPWDGLPVVQHPSCYRPHRAVTKRAK